VHQTAAGSASPPATHPISELGPTLCLLGQPQLPPLCFLSLLSGVAQYLMACALPTTPPVTID
jgi:hypothetical protein